MKTSVPFLMFACLLAAPVAHAQATRTWVSGVGDDVNPCSRTAPGKTFAGAISKTATAGEINVLDAGGYGAVTITKSMTIDGVGAQASILASNTTGVTVNIPANGIVTLRNLSINGAGNGIRGVKIYSASEVNIENCVIFGFAQKGIEITSATPVRVNLRNCIIKNCVAGAVYGNTNTILTMSDCSLMSSQYGVRLEGGATGHIEDCMISGHAGNGVVIVTSGILGGPAFVSINDCMLVDNAAAGVHSSGATSTARISNSTITGNVTGISVFGGGTLVSYGNNQISGNTTDGAPTSTILLK